VHVTVAPTATVAGSQSTVVVVGSALVRVAWPWLPLWLASPPYDATSV
jgi:hypothetical protein